MNKILLLFLSLIFGTSLALSQVQNYYLGTGTPADEAPTSCASCHTAGSTARETPYYDTWKLTKHAQAQDSISVTNSHFGYDCLRCHNVGWDPAVDNYGADEYVKEDTTTTPNYVITNQEDWERVKNVGCESCHGPQGTADRQLDLVKHFTGGIKLDYSAENCGKCHSEAHHPYFEEWSQSGHALSAQQSFIVNNPNCVKCHVAQSFIAYAQDPANYKPAILATGQDIQPITCVACHDPHSNENIHQLRFPIVQGSKVICDQCHTTGIDSVDINSTPNHTTSECLSGSKDFGYQYPGEKYPNSPHTYAVLNRCVTCHVHASSTADPVTGFFSTGHTFYPKTAACAQPNCHPNYYSEVDTSNHDKRFDYKRAQTVTDSLIDVLTDKLAGASAADSATDSFKEAKYNLLACENEGSHGVHNTLLVQKLLTDAISHFTPTGVKELNEMPATFTLSQNYPNPFNPSTEIKFSVPYGSNVNITVYDILGNKVITLINGYYAQGTYKVRWDAQNCASGIYLYKIEAANFVMTKKMVLLK
ncbi:MAG: T9SS type A sorting domain-containing protein [Ignavibacteriaceae bacterium]